MNAVSGIGGRSRALVRFMTISSSSSAPFSGRVDSISVEVADSPHIIERFTDLIDKHQMNVAELVSRITPAQHNLPPTLYIQMTAHSPTRTSGTPFEQAFNTLCQELNAQGPHSSDAYR